MDPIEMGAAGAEGGADESNTIGDGSGGAPPLSVGEYEMGADAAGAPADDWTPPSREEWESTRKHAEIGREFSPYAEKIRGFISQGFTPAQAREAAQGGHAPAQAPGSQRATREDDDEFSNPELYGKAWERIAKDPTYFRSLIHREAQRGLKDHLAKLEAFEKRFGQIEPRVNQLHGFALVAQQRFQSNPEWQKHEPRALELVNSGKVADLATAFAHAKQEARVKQLEAEAKARAAGALPPGAPRGKVAPKPAPRPDKSLHDSRAPRGAGRGSPEAGVSAKPNQSLARAAMQRAATEVGM